MSARTMKRQGAANEDKAAKEAATWRRRLQKAVVSIFRGLTSYRLAFLSHDFREVRLALWNLMWNSVSRTFVALLPKALTEDPVRIVFAGLDNSGKTTLAHYLQTNKLKVLSIEPTTQAVCGTAHFSELPVLSIVDLSGTARRAWRQYYTDAKAIVFFIDATDKDRIEESKTELNKMFEDKSLDGVPFAILGNKAEVPSAYTNEELSKLLDVEQLAKSRHTKLFMCSVHKKQGFEEALLWLNPLLRGSPAQA
eukprot:Colp12_sorted_trinity150504_noHs@5365